MKTANEQRYYPIRSGCSTYLKPCRKSSTNLLRTIIQCAHKFECRIDAMIVRRLERGQNFNQVRRELHSDANERSGDVSVNIT